MSYATRQNTAENAYFEVFSQKKHICPNRSNNNNTNTANNTNRTSPFYSKKPWVPKPKMSNSLELLTGPINEIQRKYEILSDIVITEYNGKVHGSQSHILQNNSMSLIVYYEIPAGEGKREEVKQRFNNSIIYIKNCS